MSMEQGGRGAQPSPWYQGARLGHRCPRLAGQRCGTAGMCGVPQGAGAWTPVPVASASWLPEAA